MIRHVIRPERDGGLWLIRDQGRVIRFGQAAFRWLEAMLSADRQQPLGPLERAAEDDSPRLHALIREHRLHKPTLRPSIRWVDNRTLVEQSPRDAAAAPKRIYFELTRQCNLACRSCCNRSHLALADERGLSGALDVNRQAWELGVFEMRYTGGECTTLPWFPDLIADAVRRGFFVSLGSNGVWSDQVNEWLPGAGIDWVILSLDGGRVHNDQVRGRGTYDRVLASLRLLAEHGVRTRLNMVVARHNLADIERVAEIAIEHGVGSLNLIPLRPYGRSVRDMIGDMLTQQEFFQFIREINRLRQRHRQLAFSTTIDLLDPQARTSHDPMVEKRATCAAGVEACVVGPRGDVYGCSYSPASFPEADDPEGWRTFVAGNLSRESLGEIWRDSRRWSVFRDLERHKHPKCLGCGHYRSRCSGSCPIMAWHELGRADDGRQQRAAIGEVCDPYCFTDLLADERPETEG